MNNSYIYAVQILFITCIAFVHKFLRCNLITEKRFAYLNDINYDIIEVGSQMLDDKLKWLNIARYAIYLLTIQAFPEVCKLTYQYYSRQLKLPDLLQVVEPVRAHLAIYLASAALLVYFEQQLVNQEFVFLFLGYLLVKYPDMAEAGTVISYGVGMACSYFEGYLVHVIPSDGSNFVGFEENIRILEDEQGICFPVKKMFIIITKSLYSPPDLKEFNKGTDKPHLEVFNSLRDVERSIAGVKNRIYRNTAYKIYRPGAKEGVGAVAAAAPVCLAAECATPLHTLHRVLNNRTLYTEMANVDVERVVSDFCTTLHSILEKSPQCRGKCELVYYDNDDPTQNLAEILLERIRKFAPDFEERIAARRQDNVLLEH